MLTVAGVTESLKSCVFFHCHSPQSPQRVVKTFWSAREPQRLCVKIPTLRDTLVGTPEDIVRAANRFLTHGTMPVATDPAKEPYAAVDKIAVNQGMREAEVISHLFLDGRWRALVEYTMPAGTTGLMLLDIHADQTVAETGTPIAYTAVPVAWLRHMIERGEDWSPEPQKGREILSVVGEHLLRTKYAKRIDGWRDTGINRVSRHRLALPPEIRAEIQVAEARHRDQLFQGE